MAKPEHMHILEQTAQPAQLVTLAEVKLHCRIDGNDEDTLLNSYIDAATSMIDGEAGLLGWFVATSKWLYKTYYSWHYDGFGNVLIYLPYTPVKQIMSIQYYNVNNVLITENLADWDLVTGKDWAYITPKNNLMRTEYRRLDAFQVEFQVGAEVIPNEIKQAALLIIANWYESREDNAEAPIAAQRLINLKRKGWIG